MRHFINNRWSCCNWEKRSMILYYVLLLVMTVTASFASFFLKKSTNGGTILSILTNKYLYAGGFLYVITALLSIWLLKKIPFSVIVPLGSITYIWTLIIAAIFLKEKINIGKIIGVSLILAGIICIAL